MFLPAQCLRVLPTLALLISRSSLVSSQDTPSPYGTGLAPDVVYDPLYNSSFPDFEGPLDLGTETNDDIGADLSEDTDLTVSGPERRATKNFYLRVMPLGASITAGYHSTDNNGYRRWIRSKLRYEGWKVNMVGSLQMGTMNDNDNEGHSGMLIGNVQASFTAVKSIQPNLVLLNAGTNDCVYESDVAHGGDRMRQLVDVIYAAIPGVTVVMSTILPFPAHASCSESLSQQIRNVFQSYKSSGKRVALADMHAGMTLDLLSSDKEHPNDAGYKKMAAIWWDAISKIQDQIQPPNANGKDDSVPKSSVCNKVAGNAAGPVQTQMGSGHDDGIYSHSSISRDVIGKIDQGSDKIINAAIPTHIFFAQLNNPFNADRAGALDDWIRILHDANGTNTYYYRKNLGGGSFGPSQTFDVDMDCDAGPAYAFADFNNDGLDDFWCIGTYSKVSISLNRGGDPPRFQSIGAVIPTHDGYTAADVRIADIDGDGRADYCLLNPNGDVDCSRNAGQGDSVGWGGFSTAAGVRGRVFPGKNKGDNAGIRFGDLNGDFRADWMYVGDQGNVDTWINQRGYGQGIVPNWVHAGLTHGGMGFPGIRDHIRFGRIYGSGRLDYIWLKNEANRYDMHAFENKGTGGTKLKGDGVFYCDMRGTGTDDYVWIHQDGHAAELYENIHAPPYWKTGPLILFSVPGPRVGIHLADWDGDGRCDVLVQNKANGALTMYRNDYNKNTDTFKFTNVGVVTGAASCSQGWGVGIFDRGLRLHDVDGDGRADYLCIEPNGRITAWLNPKSGLQNVGQIKFSEGWDRANIRFTDVEHSGRADLLHLNKYTGSVTVYKNLGHSPGGKGSSFSWANRGALYSPIDRGETMNFANFGGLGRADLVHVLPITNRAWTYFNRCPGGSGGDDGPVTDPGLPPYSTSGDGTVPTPIPEMQKWMTAKCTDPGINDANAPSRDRWAAADAETAWTAVADYWSSHKNLKFPAEISNFFHGPDQLDCGITDIQNGCNSPQLCKDNGPDSTGYQVPAGFLIINSMISISNMLVDFHEAVQNSGSKMTAQMTDFSDNFAFVPDEDKSIKLALDLLGLAFALAASGVWNSVFKSLDFFKRNPNTLGTIKDMVNPLVSNGITIGKDEGIPGLRRNNVKLLQDAMNAMIEEMASMTTGVQKDLFDGSDASRSQIHTIIGDGKMLGNVIRVSQDDTIKRIERVLYTVLIPYAWSIAEFPPYPFILDPGYDCEHVGDIQHLDPDLGKRANGCSEGRYYALSSAAGPAQSCSDGGDGVAVSCSNNNFAIPPGLDQLNGQKYGGITPSDIVVGSVATFRLNKGVNRGGTLPAPTDKSFLDGIVDDDILAPGVWNIPVCGAGEAFNNWSDQWFNGQKWPNYPCNP